MNQYIVNPEKPQEISGIPSMYQNIANQQAMQAAALSQGNQLAQQAGQAGQAGQQGGANPMALAMALRKSEKKDPTKAGNPAPVTDYSEEYNG